MSDQNGLACSTPGSGCNPPQLKFYQAFTFATPIIFTLVLLLLFCVLYVRRRQTARAVSQLRAQFFARGLFSAWPIDHGLTKSFRATLPTIIFDESFAASREDNQCAVCLSDYQLGEKLQQLPLCDHVFHVECIDEWLASNATCPICRTSLLQVGKLVPLDTLNSLPPLDSLPPGQAAPPNRTPGESSTTNARNLIPSGVMIIGEAPAASSSSTSSDNINPKQDQQQQQQQLKIIKIPPVPSSSSSSEGPSHRSVPSMEDVVKDSASEHVIHIER